MELYDPAAAAGRVCGVKSNGYFRIGDFDRRSEVTTFDRDPDGVSFGGQLNRHDQ
jgi:hypothetical protein